MLLSKGTNNIGYINSELSLAGNDSSCEDLVDIILETLTTDLGMGLNVSCFQIPGNFNFPDFSFYDEEEKDSKVWEISAKVRSGQRIVFFLPTYFFLGSQIPEVVEKTKKELVKIASFLEIVGISGRSICIKVGSAYGMRKQTMDRFCKEVLDLPLSVRNLLSVANDEKPSLFSVTDLLSGVYYEVKIPITFRFLAHSFNSGGLSFREAFYLSSSTWDGQGKPILLHSESSEVDDNGVFISPVPSEFLKHRIPTFGLSVDCIIDSPVGDKACIRYMSEYLSLKPMVINKVSSK